MPAAQESLLADAIQCHRPFSLTGAIQCALVAAAEAVLPEEETRPQTKE